MKTTVNAADLLAAVRALEAHAMADPTSILASIEISIEDSGAIAMVATDSHRMAVTRIPLSRGSFPDHVRIIANLAQPTSTVSVNRDRLLAAVKAIPANPKESKHHNDLRLRINGAISLSAGDSAAELPCNHSGDDLSLTVDRRYFAATLGAVNPGRGKSILIDFRGPTGAISVHADGSPTTSILMPIKP